MCAMAERRHSQEQRELAELRLRQGHPAAAVARDLKLPERSVARWRDALGITPKPRGFPRGKPRRVTALSVEPDFADWVAKLGKHFADLQTLAESRDGLLVKALKNWRIVTRGTEFRDGERVFDPSAAIAVGGAIESQAASALFARAGGKDWDAVGAESLRERALPASAAQAHAEGERLRSEVLTRLVALRDAQPTGSPLDAACVIVASRLLSEDLARWAYDGEDIAQSESLWQSTRLRELRSRNTRRR
jgi:hypothetical protein